MSEPTYRIAQALHERRAAVGLPKYGQHLSAASPGCMIVHAIEEAADLTEYLLAEAQRRADAIRKLMAMVNDMEAQGYWPMMHRANAVIDLLGGEAALAKYDEILGTVAENATVAPEPTDNALPALLDELEAARRENATMRATIISAMVDVQHNLPGNGHAKLSLLLDGIMKAPRNNEERLREEVRRLTQANGDLRQERDRAVAEAQRQYQVAKGLRAAKLRQEAEGK